MIANKNSYIDGGGGICRELTDWSGNQTIASLQTNAKTSGIGITYMADTDITGWAEVIAYVNGNYRAITIKGDNKIVFTQSTNGGSTWATNTSYTVKRKDVSVDVNQLSWVQSGQGKYYATAGSADGHILSVSIAGWENVKADDYVTPYISASNDKNFGLQANKNTFYSGSSYTIRLIYV